MMGRYLIKEPNSAPPLAGLYITSLMGHVNISITLPELLLLPCLYVFVRASTVTFKTPLEPLFPHKGPSEKSNFWTGLNFSPLKSVANISE